MELISIRVFVRFPVERTPKAKPSNTVDSGIVPVVAVIVERRVPVLSGPV
jgi:hypothetical protein